VARTARHLAIIPDGNRRWARERGLDPSEGHAAGLSIMGAMADCAFAEGVEVFTFWWGSVANLTRRDPREIARIVDGLDTWLREEAPPLLARWGAAFAMHGRWRELFPALGGAAAEAGRAAGRSGRALVVLMGYSGHDEVRAAVEEAGAEGDARAFEGRLWTAAHPPVDLVIRTGRARHLSAGFMLWSIGEASIAFEDEMWPAYTPDDLRRRLRWYAAEERRYGS
jgi:undecaprenyl diphosphate synthase